MEKTTEQKYVGNFDEVFPIIDSSELIGHKLLEHVPRTKLQKNLLANIRYAIKIKLPAFRVPCMDPSEENGKIVFNFGKKPAVGHSAAWWNETWKDFMPSKNSRSGNELHYAVFLGKLIKYLIDEKKYLVKAAWEAVCNNSRGLGHYSDSKDAKHNLEPTGSRKVGDFFDLANTCKILNERIIFGFLLAGGDCHCYGGDWPLADVATIEDPDGNLDFCVGWLVMDV